MAEISLIGSENQPITTFVLHCFKKCWLIGVLLGLAFLNLLTRRFMMNTKKVTPFKFGIQLLILLHFSVFILPLFILSRDVSSFALSSNFEGLSSNWWSVATYHFVHTGIDELLLSMGALWFFGSILQKRIGGMKVLQLYFVSAFAGSAVFILAHQIFPTFAGRNHMMEGAFISVLAIMTATVATCGSKHTCKIGRLSVSLWQIYLAVLAISFVSFYQHNIACVLTCSSSIIIGIRYVAQRKRYFYIPDAVPAKHHLFRK